MNMPVLQVDREHAIKDFKNASGLEFARIDSEAFRVYVYAKDGKRVEERIDEPIYLHVSASGGHRVYDATMTCHYMPPGWVRVYWRVRDEEPHFVK